MGAKYSTPNGHVRCKPTFREKAEDLGCTFVPEEDNDNQECCLMRLPEGWSVYGTYWMNNDNMPIVSFYEKNESHDYYVSNRVLSEEESSNVKAEIDEKERIRALKETLDTTNTTKAYILRKKFNQIEHNINHTYNTRETLKHFKEFTYENLGFFDTENEATKMMNILAPQYTDHYTTLIVIRNDNMIETA